MEKIYSVFSRNDLGLFLELLLFTSNQSHLFFCPAVSHTPLTTGHYICSADGKTNTDTFMSSLHTHTINICVVLYTEYRVFTLVVFFFSFMFHVFFRKGCERAPWAVIKWAGSQARSRFPDARVVLDCHIKARPSGRPAELVRCSLWNRIVLDWLRRPTTEPVIYIQFFFSLFLYIF